MGFRDALRQRAMGSVTPSETAIGQEAVNILTTTEYQLLQSLQRLVEATDDLDDVLRVGQTPADREAEILGAADALADQRFEAWWWEEYGDQLVDEPEDARERVGLSKAEWRDQLDTWADLYREHAADEVVDGKTDAQVAAMYVDARFGVDLATFASEVVEWHGPRHLQHVLRRNMVEAIRVINEVAASLEDESDVADAGDEDLDDVAASS